MVLRRTTTALACTLALVPAAALSACGEEEQGVDEPAREGLAIELGGVEYTVFITRQLNPAIPPDDAYYTGPPPGRDETLYGVFVQACNKTDEEQVTTDFFTVTDNQDNEFEPEPLPRDNPFAYHARPLEPQECIPKAGSVAQLGPSAGSMLLFRLPLATTENRPLELEVEDAQAEARTFELDI
jgi:hypothetical protein